MTRCQTNMGAMRVQAVSAEAQTHRNEHRNRSRNGLISQAGEKWEHGCTRNSQAGKPALRVSGESRQRKPSFSDSSTAERSARAATRWVHGRDRTHGTQPDGEVSDQFGLVSEDGQFRASESWPCSRLMPRSCPGEASRAIAVSWPICGASRPLVSCVLGAHELFLTVSPVCGRRNEAKRSA